jgi:hypothetical protein
VPKSYACHPSMTPDPLYYLLNFKEAIAWVVERNRDLLSDEELSFAATFAALPIAAQALLVRLIMRRGTLFRHSKINYPEVGDFDGALSPLVNLGWIDSQPGLSLADLFRLSTREELSRQFPVLRSGISKHGAYDVLSTRYTEVATFAQWMGTEEPVYRVRIDWMATRFRLLFFGTFHQEWSEFVLAQLGIFKFERVEIDQDSRPFTCRADIDCFYALHDCKEAFQSGEPMAEVLWLLPEGPLETDWLLEHREKLRFRIGEALERDDDVETALLVYEGCRYSEARIRRALVLERQGRYADAAIVVQDALDNRPSEAEVQKLERIAARVRHHRFGAKVRRRVAHPSTTLRLPSAPSTRVELAVRDQLSHDQAPIFYVQNSLICSLFCLLCWEAIFKPVRGAFFHRFHTAPADLDSPDFQARRHSILERCLARLDEGTYRDHITKTFADKFGTQSPFVHWQVLTTELLELSLTCIRAEDIKLYCTRLLRGLRENCTGLPDLIQFDLQKHSYKMIEVKGPGDRLQDNQRRWLHYCSEHKLPMEVCQVTWSD